MSVRMLSHVGLLYQDLVRTRQLTERGRLPPVLPIVLYNGEPRWDSATDIFDLIENVPGSLARFSPRMRYLLIDEGVYEHAELESLRNLVSVLFQLEKTPAEEMTRALFDRLIEWVSDNPELQRAFVVFLKRVYFQDRVDVEDIYRQAEDTGEVKDMLSKNVERWIEEWKAEGKAEGEAKLREVALKLLATSLPISQISEITGLSIEELEELRSSMAN